MREMREVLREERAEGVRAPPPQIHVEAEERDEQHPDLTPARTLRAADGRPRASLPFSHVRTAPR